MHISHHRSLSTEQFRYILITLWATSFCPKYLTEIAIRNSATMVHKPHLPPLCNIRCLRRLMAEIE